MTKMHNSPDYSKTSETRFRNTKILRELAKHLINKARKDGVSQETLAINAGVKQPTISKWGNSEGSPPNLIAIMGMCIALDTSLDQLLQEVYVNHSPYTSIEGEGATIDPVIDSYSKAFRTTYDATDDKCYDSSLKHRQRLSMFENKEYIGFYLHQTSNKNIVLNSLLIETYEVDDRGFCPFSMNINKNLLKSKSTTVNKANARYAGKIVSPPNTLYAYFYITGGDPTERGMWVLYYPTLIDGGYRCGSGVLLSIDRSKHSPSFQRIALIDKRYYEDSQKQRIIEILQKPLSSLENPIMFFSESELKKTHATLFSLLKKTEE